MGLKLHNVLHAKLRKSLTESRTWPCAAHQQSYLHPVSRVTRQHIHSKACVRCTGSPSKGIFDGVVARLTPRAIEWTIPALETSKLDHLATWEMEHFQVIHAKKVSLGRVLRYGPDEMYKIVIQQIVHGRAPPEAAEVHIPTDWSDEDFGELQSVCSAKWVRLIYEGSGQDRKHGAARTRLGNAGVHVKQTAHLGFLLFPSKPSNCHICPLALIPFHLSITLKSLRANPSIDPSTTCPY